MSLVVLACLERRNCFELTDVGFHFSDRLIVMLLFVLFRVSSKLIILIM